MDSRKVAWAFARDDDCSRDNVPRFMSCILDSARDLADLERVEGATDASGWTLLDVDVRRLLVYVDVGV